MTWAEEKAKLENTEMTLEKAKTVIGIKYPSIYWDGISPARFLAIQALAEGFICGHAAGRECEKANIVSTCDKILADIQDPEAAYSLGKKWTAEMIKGEVQK